MEESHPLSALDPILSNCKVGSYSRRDPASALWELREMDFVPQRPGSHGQTFTEGLTYQERERECFQKVTRSQARQGSRRVGVWDAAQGVGRVHPNRPFRTFFSWLEDERMRGLGSQREEGMLCGKNGMNRDRDGNEQVTED